MKYFFDNCISYRFAHMLAALDVDVVSLQDRYPANTDDVFLFESLRGSGHVFVTADKSQTTRSLEARALKESGMTAIFLGPF